MRPPFPGMDPWLEAPDIWPGIHGSLIVSIRDDLAAKVAPRCFVDIEERVYLVQPDSDVYLGRPDVVLSGPKGATPSPRGPARASSMVDDFVETDIQIPRLEKVKIRRLAIRLASNRELVTAIELLSPSNKVDRRGRKNYIEKRQMIFESLTNFVEIDLLRAGKPMPFEGGLSRADYRILIAREEAYPGAKLREFSIRQPIPPVPIPLMPGEAEPSVDLNSILHGVYERARYDLRIDYSTPPVPPLNPDDAEWASGIVADQIRRA